MQQFNIEPKDMVLFVAELVFGIIIGQLSPEHSQVIVFFIIGLGIAVITVIAIEPQNFSVAISAGLVLFVIVLLVLFFVEYTQSQLVTTGAPVPSPTAVVAAAAATATDKPPVPSPTPPPPAPHIPTMATATVAGVPVVIFEAGMPYQTGLSAENWAALPGQPVSGEDSPFATGELAAAFAIDRHEVSVALFYDGVFSPGSLPQVNVTGREAQQFCAQRGGRLPYEHEWELAARGSAGAVFVPGWLPSSGFAVQPLRAVADSALEWLPVMAAVQGLGSNVREWVQGEGLASDILLVKGAGYLTTDPLEMRLTLRCQHPFDSQFPDVGFRCAYDWPQ